MSNLKISKEKDNEDFNDTESLILDNDNSIKDELKEYLREFIEVSENYTRLQKRKKFLQDKIKKIMADSEIPTLTYKGCTISYKKTERVKPVPAKKLTEIFEQKLIGCKEIAEHIDDILANINEEIENNRVIASTETLKLKK